MRTCTEHLGNVAFSIRIHPRVMRDFASSAHQVLRRAADGEAQAHQGCGVKGSKGDVGREVVDTGLPVASRGEADPALRVPMVWLVPRPSVPRGVSLPVLLPLANLACFVRFVPGAPPTRNSCCVPCWFEVHAHENLPKGHTGSTKYHAVKRGDREPSTSHRPAAGACSVGAAKARAMTWHYEALGQRCTDWRPGHSVKEDHEALPMRNDGCPRAAERASDSDRRLASELRGSMSCKAAHPRRESVTSRHGLYDPGADSGARSVRDFID
eukprot:scaffold305662_cov33-Tisochrysis_lutea.AAC.3